MEMRRHNGCDVALSFAVKSTSTAGKMHWTPKVVTMHWTIFNYNSWWRKSTPAPTYIWVAKFFSSKFWHTPHSPTWPGHRLCLVSRTDVRNVCKIHIIHAHDQSTLLPKEQKVIRRKVRIGLSETDFQLIKPCKMVMLQPFSPQIHYGINHTHRKYRWLL